MATIKPPGPPYTYQNIKANYNEMIRVLNEFQKKNNLFLKETNNIDQLPDFSTLVKTMPTGSPNPNNKYDFMNAINLSSQDDVKKTIDVANEDTYELIIQQNTMYILGSLACASLLIASIFIGKRT